MMATIDVDFAVYKALTIRRETEEFGHQTLRLVKLGWRNLVGDRIEFMSQKGSEKYAPSISLPLTGELREALDQVTHDQPTFLINE